MAAILDDIKQVPLLHLCQDLYFLLFSDVFCHFRHFIVTNLPLWVRIPTGSWIFSREEAVQLAYVMSVVLLRCSLVPEIHCNVPVKLEGRHNIIIIIQFQYFCDVTTPKPHPRIKPQKTRLFYHFPFSYLTGREKGCSLNTDSK